MRVDKKTIKTSMTGKCYHLPLKLVNNTFGNNLKFHSNLELDDSSFHSFPKR